MTTSLSRAGVRRMVTLFADGERDGARNTLVQPELAGSDGPARFAAYLLDPVARPLVADPRCLLERAIGPGCAVAVSDDVAAIVAASRWVAGDKLADELLAARFNVRADEAVAAAVARLSPEAATKAIAMLAQPGPDEATLHLATLQAGRALAWRPELAAPELVQALLALLDRASPRPLLQALVGVLGPLAAAHLEIRGAVMAKLGAARAAITGRRTGASFLAELEALDKPRTVPDEDYLHTLPDRELLEAASEILGRAAGVLDPAGFVPFQQEVLADDESILPYFVDGLISAGAIGPLGQLVEQLVDSTDEESRTFGLVIASQLPLDACSEQLVACLDDRRPQVRARAIQACTLLEPDIAVPAIAARLDDLDPGVCARAGRALVELGERAQLAERRIPSGPVVGKARERTAAARSALGEASVDVVGTLLPLVAAQAETADSLDDAPLVDALGWVFLGSPEGLQLAAAVVQEIPDALPIVALVLSGGDEPTPLVVSEAARAELAATFDPLIEQGGEAGMLSLAMLSRFSLGDAAMVDRILDADARNDGYAQHVLAALANLRVRSDRAAQVLGPLLEDVEHFPAVLLAAGVAGVALPVEHRLWARVSELLGLGVHARAAAYAALASRRRIHSAVG